MARKQFETVVAQAPKKFLYQYYHEETGIRAAGTDDIILVYAPENHICTVSGLIFTVPAPSGAASGTHRLIIGYDMDNSLSGSLNIDVAFAESNFGDPLSIFDMSPTSATSRTVPSFDVFPLVLSLIKFDSTTPLSMVYSNKTNIEQTNVRKYMATFVAEEIAGGGA